MAKKIAATKVGKTITVRFGGKTYVRPSTKEEYAQFKELAEKYKEKPTETNENKLIKFLTPKVTAKKAEIGKKIGETKAKAKAEVSRVQGKEAVLASIKKQISEGGLSETEINELGELVDKARKIEVPAAPVSKPRSGEFYH